MTEKVFNADVEQLIQLVTHSIYSNKEIFLRELISNANDTIQKAKLMSAQDAQYLGDDHELKVTIDIDRAAKVITIKDNGIGMTAEEVEKNIGTIAKSGTKEFLQKIKDQKEANNQLIGQFGIGFYSAFMVADKVELETKANDAKKGVLWTSDGKGKYDIVASQKTSRGTEIRLFINAESEEFLDNIKLRSLIRRNSNFVPVPVMMINEKEGANGEYDQVNAMKSIWTKAKADLKPEDYTEFYKELAFDFAEPLDHIHLDVEGGLNYKAILYIPQKTNPFANMHAQDQKYGLQLYVQNVLIMEKCEELLPVWLRFVRGVVETNDLPLNISREILQNSSVMAKLQSSLIKEVLKTLEYNKNNKTESYDEFLQNYGNVLKEGIHYDFANKEKVSGLVKFYSLLQGKNITLDEYIANPPSPLGQGGTATEKIATDKKEIYYITGKSLNELKSNPYVEQFKDHGIDVLLLSDPIDEYVISNLQKYKEYDLKSITSAGVEFDDETTQEKKKEAEKKMTENKDFIAFFLETVGQDKLEKVSLTHKLKNALTMFASQEGQPSPQMEKIMKAMGQQIPPIKRTLEINSNHPIVEKMLSLYNTDKNSDDLKKLVKYTYDQAVLLEGGDIDNMSEFIKVANELVSK